VETIFGREGKKIFSDNFLKRESHPADMNAYCVPHIILAFEVAVSRLSLNLFAFYFQAQHNEVL